MMTKESPMQSRSRATIVVLCLLAWSCSGDRPVELGPVEEIDGLVQATTARDMDAPQLLAGASPRLSTGVSDTLRSQQLEAVVRVLVGNDDSIVGIKVMEVRPEGTAPAKLYAEEVAASIWHWQFKAAQRAGRPVRAYIDLHFSQGPKSQ